ncbi:MAG: arylsulfatase [Candidatus Aminicenantaceae bacterium]
MKRRAFLRVLGHTGAAAWAGGALGCAAADKSPNIITILADDLGYGELGCYGQRIIRTPNLDRMAAEGMRFTQHYAGSPVCAPSRCVLLTGKHTGHAFIRNNGRPGGRPHDPESGVFAGQNPIPDSEVTVAEALKAKGYATAAIGKWGLGYPGSSGDPNQQGFDLFYGYNSQVQAHNHYPRFLLRNRQQEALEGNDRTQSGMQYSQDLFIREAKQFIRQNRSRRFFLFLPFTIPHLSIQVPEESLSEYQGKIPEEPYTHRSYFQHPYPRAAYAAMITHMDRGIGEILSLLSELGLERDTLVMFSSDNGPAYNRLGGTDSDFFQSAGPFRGLKGSVYEGGIRVPLIARWPGRIPGATVSEHVCAFWDVFPTLCDITGAKAPAGIDGLSFASTFLGSGRQDAHEYLYWEFPSYGGQQAVRLGDWKAVRTRLLQDDAEHSIQLYNLHEDGSESRNVAVDHPEVVGRAREILSSARTESELFPFPEIHTRLM